MSELQNKSLHELQKEESGLRQEIARLRIDMAANPPKDTNILKKKSKRLAQVLTIVSQK